MSPAPKWIAEALDALVLTDDIVTMLPGESAVLNGRYRLLPAAVEIAAKALIERIPIEPMARAHVGAMPRGRRDLGREAFVAVIRALTSDEEVVELTALYQEAARALDAAGVPYGTQQAALMTLADRIRWLAAERPTRIQVIQMLEEQCAQYEAQANAGIGKAKTLGLREMVEKLRNAEGSSTDYADECTREGAMRFRIERLEGQLEELSDRIATIADERFGPFAVQDAHANLTEIERCAFLQHQKNAQLENQLADARAETLGARTIRDLAIVEVAEHMQARAAMELEIAELRRQRDAARRFHDTSTAAPPMTVHLDEYKGAMAEVERQRDRITELEGKLADRDDRIAELEASEADLEGQLDETGGEG